MVHVKIFFDTVFLHCPQLGVAICDSYYLKNKNIEHIKVMMRLISMFSKNVNVHVKETAVIPTMMWN